MRVSADEGTCLAELIRVASPLCQVAERQCPRTGSGRPSDIPDWVRSGRRRL